MVKNLKEKNVMRVMWCVLLVMGLFPSVAWANDAVFGGTGAELVPLKERELRMVSEDIVIQKMKPRGKWKYDYWQIHATYIFENPTKKEKSVQLGFPERFCGEEGDCNSQKDGSRYTFWGMKTWIDGKKANVKVGKVATPEDKWGFNIGRVHLVNLKVKPGQKVKVGHQYQMGTSGSSMMDEWLTYVTKTGALWNGPIGSAKFTILVPQRPWGFRYPSAFKLKSYGPAGEGRPKGTTKIVFQMKNWTPKQDLDLLFGSNLPKLFGCPSMVITTNGGEAPESEVPNMAKAFDGMSKSQLKVCRNLPYARHGYKFKSKALQERFYGKTISQPVSSMKRGQWMFASPDSEEAKTQRVVFFAPNPDYKPSMLTPMELLWVKVVKHAEATGTKKKSAK